jgi:aarF domain-containing kinase
MTSVMKRAMIFSMVYLALTTPAVHCFLTPANVGYQYQASSALHSTPASFMEYKKTIDVKHREYTLLESLGRAREIAFVAVQEVLAPLTASLVTKGLPKGDPALFWLQKQGTMSNADRVVKALEILGPTYVKFGQALASRPDIIPLELTEALSTLQDDMEIFDDVVAKGIIRHELLLTGKFSVSELNTFMKSLSNQPIAAASIGQVYKGNLPGFGPVAIKVQRPGIRDKVEKDSALLKSIAAWLEKIPGLPGQGSLIAAKLEQAVDEFMLRLFEELDYRNEAHNLKVFYDLYSIRRTGSAGTSVRVVVPSVMSEYCTEKVLIMEWIEGSKLSNVKGESAADITEKLKLVEQGIQCTLSQLIDTGIMHADPHAGNLLKVMTEEGVQLGYLDFGLMSTVPETVRDGLVCAVAQLVFARNVEAIANLFGELQLVPESVIDNPKRRLELARALQQVFDQVITYPAVSNKNDTPIPELRFDKLLGALTLLLTKFEFAPPPYFLNNVRALGTLEGIARGLDPKFNVLRVIYPFALDRMLRNPSDSIIVDQTVESLIRDPYTGLYDRTRMKKLIDDSSLLSGRSRRQVVKDAASTRGGRRIMRRYILQLFTLRKWLARGKGGRRRVSRRQWSLTSSILQP